MVFRKSGCQRGLSCLSPKDETLFLGKYRTSSLLTRYRILLLENSCNHISSLVSRLNTPRSPHLSCRTWSISKAATSREHTLLSPQMWPLRTLSVPQSMALGTDYNGLFTYAFNILFKNKETVFLLQISLKILNFRKHSIVIYIPLLPSFLHQKKA